MRLDLNPDTFISLELSLEGAVSDSFRNFEKTDATWTGTVRDDSDAVQDITGWALEFSLYDKQGGTLIKTWDTSAGITLSDPTNGKFQITVDDADISVASTVLHGVYQFTAFSGGVLGTNPTGRVIGQAEVVEIEGD